MDEISGICFKIISWGRKAGGDIYRWVRIVIWQLLKPSDVYGSYNVFCTCLKILLYLKQNDNSLLYLNEKSLNLNFRPQAYSSSPDHASEVWSTQLWRDGGGLVKPCWICGNWVRSTPYFHTVCFPFILYCFNVLCVGGREEVLRSVGLVDSFQFSLAQNSSTELTW
jgi:hypothetical protein